MYSTRRKRKMTVVTKSLRKKYDEEVVPALKEEFKYTNVHQIPKLSKVVINMGVGEAAHNSKLAELIVKQLTKIAGQKAVITKAKKNQ
jgi:large subunit ribosomal protein L5